VGARDAILEAVAHAAERLLLSRDWLDPADDVLARLGLAADVSRAYVIENHVDAAGRARCRQLAEWCAPGVAPQMGNPALDDTPWDDIGFARWVEVMSSGGSVSGPVVDLPKAEQTVLRDQEILSLASFPVFVDDRWWGLIGFDDCTSARAWTGAELDALRAAASVLGAAIHRHRADALAREAEEHSRRLVERIPAVTYTDIPGPDGIVMGFVSPQITSLLGYAPQRFVDDPRFWVSLIHPDDRTRLQESGALNPGDPSAFEEEYRMRAADGRWVWVHDTSTAVLDVDGDIDYFLGFATDVTVHREAEERLRTAEEQLRMIIEQTPAITYQEVLREGRYDPESVISYVSPRIQRLLGFSPQEWERPGFWPSVIHPDDLAEIKQESDRVIAAGETNYLQEYRMVGKNGRVLWFHDESRLVTDVDGRPLLWQGVMVDITDRKEAEAQLERALDVEREATQRLRTLDEMKNTFLQAVSHDLRTPLAAILGLAVTLERGDVHLNESDAKDLARRIAENARRLDRLVTNLLDLDRLARGIISPKLRPTDVGALVRRVLAESELVAGSRMRTDIEPAVIPLDAAKVERIVENLLANTVRHTPEHATIWISVRPTEDGVRLAVEDDGPGVVPELRDAIFEPFRQGPDAPQHSPGVGVGLTLVKRFAELHGGRAWVEERDGGGASFRVFLPRNPRIEPEADPG
jgi:two-component system, cell cycle sensor histidine kinase and response regulator CckA